MTCQPALGAAGYSFRSLGIFSKKKAESTACVKITEQKTPDTAQKLTFHVQQVGYTFFFEFIILRPPDNMPASFRNPYDLSTPSDRKFSICKQLEKGTIVKSETKRVDENDGAAGRDMLLIGLCGVGLYSANAVSDNIRGVNAHNHREQGISVAVTGDFLCSKEGKSEIPEECLLNDCQE